MTGATILSCGRRPARLDMDLSPVCDGLDRALAEDVIADLPPRRRVAAHMGLFSLLGLAFWVSRFGSPCSLRAKAYGVC